MIPTLNNHLFLAINASSDPNAIIVAFANFAALWLVYLAAGLVPALWIWGRYQARGQLLATVLGVTFALAVNQGLGTLWYEPRPFMLGFGHTLAYHVVENSFPSDHATFLWSLGFALILTNAAHNWGVGVCLGGLIVAWARIYLGLHFPIDMAASFLVGVMGGGVAKLLVPMSGWWLRPIVDKVYESALDQLHLPAKVFPRPPSR